MTGDLSVTQEVIIILLCLVVGLRILALQFIPYNIVIANVHTSYNNVFGINSLLFTVPGDWFRYYSVEGILTTLFILQMLSILVCVYLINDKLFSNRQVL